jgi:hypothetical protein
MQDREFGEESRFGVACLNGITFQFFFPTGSWPETSFSKWIGMESLPAEIEDASKLGDVAVFTNIQEFTRCLVVRKWKWLTETCGTGVKPGSNSRIDSHRSEVVDY